MILAALFATALADLLGPDEAGMFDYLQRSWDLMIESLSVLGRDKRLLVFPVLSGIATILMTISFVLPLNMAGVVESRVFADSLRHGDPRAYFVLFLFYFANYFVTIFFNSALVAAAGLCLEGAPATVSDGLRLAGKRLGRIAYWALFSATVRLLLRIIERQTGRAGRVAAGLVGISWSVVTYFIIPVIVFENRPVVESIDRSMTLFRKAWGEQVTSGVGFSLIWLLASIPGIGLAYSSLSSRSMLGIGVALFYVLCLATIASAAKGVFTVALYRYAAHAEAPGWFSGDLLQGAFISRSGSMLFGPAADKNQPVMEGSLLGVELMPSETANTYIIYIQAGQTEYHASYTLEAIDAGFQADSWQPGTPLKLRVCGDWLLISGPACPELWCRYTKVVAPHLG